MVGEFWYNKINKNRKRLMKKMNLFFLSIFFLASPEGAILVMVLGKKTVSEEDGSQQRMSGF